MIWQIDISDCPCQHTISDKLNQIKFKIENNLVDASDFDPETLSSEGFSNVEGLFEYLEQGRPEEDLVFSHGDYSFPNVFVSGDNITCFINWGYGGAASCRRKSPLLQSA